MQSRFRFSLAKYWFYLATLDVCSAYAFAQPVPPLTNDEPAAGLRVRMVLPEYDGHDLFHALYLPTNWQQGERYPVIVEYAPNFYPPLALSGEVEDTLMGFYQSGGEDFIWVTMPFVHHLANPIRHAVWWWGSAGAPFDPVGQTLAAEYSKAAILDILENYGGDHANVFVTGFSRGAIGCGYIALADEEISDIWAGFLPFSHHDGGTFTPDPTLARLGRVADRPSFISWGQFDDGKPNSQTGAMLLTSLGFPVQTLEIPGIGHSDLWIIDHSIEREIMRAWLQNQINDNPGTHTVSGRIADAQGLGIPGLRIQSGLTHWTETDNEGYYSLPGLVNGNRILTVSPDDCAELSATEIPLLVDGADITDFDILADYAFGIPQVESAESHELTVAQPFLYDFAVTCGLQPFVWSVVEGSLAPGLNLNAESGRISGTPHAIGSSTCTVQLVDAAGATVGVPLTMDVVPPEGLSLAASPTIVPPQLPVHVRWTVPHGVANRSDWLGLYRVEGANAKPLAVYPTRGILNGVMIVRAPMAHGRYEFRYMRGRIPRVGGNPNGPPLMHFATSNRFRVERP